MTLVELPQSKWHELRDLYRKNNWSDDAVAFCLRDTHVTYPSLAEFCKLKIYSLDGDMTDGCVVICFHLGEVMLFPLKNIDKLEKALVDTNIIDWTEILYVSSASREVEQCLRRLEKPLGIKVDRGGNTSFTHFLDRNSEPFDISNYPPDTYTAELNPEHLHIVDKTWTYYSENSHKLFQSLLELHLTYVLYSTKDNFPLAWVTLSWEGSLTHLYTIEEHRRKGYAEYILKVAVNDQLSRGKDVIGFTLERNVKAQNLFNKLNFKIGGFLPTNMEPLEEIPRSKWPELRNLYRNNWPDNAVAYCFLDTQISYPNLTEFCNLKIYSPEGNITNGFVAIYFNEGDAYDVMIRPLKNVGKIENALAHTKIIRWTGGLYISSASPVIEECMRRLEAPLGIKLKTEGNKAMEHFLDRNSKQFEISNSPPDTYVAELKPENLPIVEKTWTFNSDRSYKFFQSLLKNHLTYALYSTKDESPLAWVTISWAGSLTHLYTMEHHRRKGYAEYILKVAANDQLSKGKNVLGYTLEDNLKAQMLFDKLNFERTGIVTWIFIEKE